MSKMSVEYSHQTLIDQGPIQRGKRKKKGVRQYKKERDVIELNAHKRGHYYGSSRRKAFSGQMTKKVELRTLLP